jgi:chromosomal replication initiator protein
MLSDAAKARAVIEMVASHYRVRVQDLLGSRRHLTLTRVRALAMYLVRRHTHMSFPELGRLFRKHHTTVLAAWRRAHDLIGQDMETALTVIDIGRALEKRIALRADPSRRSA